MPKDHGAESAAAQRGAEGNRGNAKNAMLRRPAASAPDIASAAMATTQLKVSKTQDGCR